MDQFLGKQLHQKIYSLQFRVKIWPLVPSLLHQDITRCTAVLRKRFCVCYLKNRLFKPLTTDIPYIIEELILYLRFLSIPPETIRKPLIFCFWCFQGVHRDRPLTWNGLFSSSLCWINTFYTVVFYRISLQKNDFLILDIYTFKHKNNSRQAFTFLICGGIKNLIYKNEKHRFN